MLVLLLRVLTITFCLLSFLRDITECYVLDVVVSVVSCTEMMSGCVVCANCLSSLCLLMMQLMLIYTMRILLCLFCLLHVCLVCCMFVASCIED